MLVKAGRYRNVLLNMSAAVLPMLVGIWVVPHLLGTLGPDRFGFLSIGWVLVGYFGILDFGLSKGLTQHIATQRGIGTPKSIIAGIVHRVRFLLICIGLAWAVMLVLVAPWLVGGVLNITPNLHTEALYGLMFLAATVPALMWMSASVGTLEGCERFFGLSVVRISMGLGIFLVPWAISQYTPHLGFIFFGLFAVRFSAALVLAVVSSEFLRQPNLEASRSHIREIMRFGGWFSISNMFGQSMTYIDRLMIGSMVSVAAVTYYTVPMDALARLPALPLAMMGALMPGFAAAFANREASGNPSQLMYAAAVRAMVAGWLPLMIALALWGQLILTAWVGERMASESLVVWQILAVGVMVNGFSHIPYALLQSLGRTDIIAKIHLAEVVPYMAALWFAIGHFGIAGAAAVWAIRMGVELILFYGLAAQLMPEVRASCYQAVLIVAVGSVLMAVLTSFSMEQSPYSMLIFTLAILFWFTLHYRRLKSVMGKTREVELFNPKD